jgi:uroporphyrinogen-III synthase
MNKRVLVTRPQAQSAALIAALQEQGDIPVVLPLLNIVTYNESEHSPACEAIKSKVLRLDEYQHLIFISTNAVTAGWHWIDRYWPQLPVAQRWYAIGEATAAALLQHVECAQPEKIMNSEGLLALPALQNISQQKVLIFRGKGGRDFLRQALQERGAQVDYCEVYERQAVHYTNGELAKFLGEGLDLLTVTSGETLQLLLEQAVNDGIKEDIQKLPIIVPGQRVADLARASGFDAVLVAENASVPAILNACN